MMKAETKTTTVTDAVTKHFLALKAQGEKAMAQLDDTEVHWKHAEGDNSIFVLVAHLHGNMLSRFTDFLVSDGEKAWRNRDNEFVDATGSKEKMMNLWEEGWASVLQAVRPLTDADLGRKVTVRGEPHTVAEALLRQMAHYAGHVGQMVYIAKTVKGSAWKTLSIPRAAAAPSDETKKSV